MQLQGLFWAIDPPKSKESRQPPEPVWLSPDYLPGLAEARAFNVPLMTSYDDLQLAQRNGEQLICDIEEFQNYFLAAFTSMETGKCWYVEFQTTIGETDRLWLYWVLHNFQIVTFNGNGFDIPILALALAGKTCLEIYHAGGMLIYQEIKPWIMLKSYKVQQLDIDHIDLIEVCPLSASLKIYGGRLHVPKMQDLPFPHDIPLSDDQIAIVRFYCINDLTTTAFVNVALSEQLAIRKEMSLKYDVDLRSKSDAQIAEAVIKAELKRLNGFDCYRPEIEPGTSYMYHPPAFITFQTPEMIQLLKDIRTARFVVTETGGLWTPDELVTPETRHNKESKDREPRQVKIGKAIYTVGIGGLHSNEESVAHYANHEFMIVDRDVASYYPQIILNQKLYPLHLGFDFLTVYQSLVTRRLAAKRSGNKIEADMLKIVINGSFGKFGSKWSALYSPDLLIQVTISGQLALLMLIERLELSGIQIISANTDGIVMKYPRIMQDVVDAVVEQWEADTCFETEATEYKALYSRDVNNYIAMKPCGKVKVKGAYSNPWSEKGSEIFRFHKNPTNTIVVEAVTEFLTKGTPIRDTIRNCGNLTKFLTVRKVKGGAVKDGVFLGKAIRWYYSTASAGEIVYATSGNKVPKSDGARPCLDLPEAFPADMDFSRYEKEAWEVLQEIGCPF